MKVKFGITKIIFSIIIKVAIPIYILKNFHDIFRGFGLAMHGLVISEVMIVLFILISIDKIIREILDLIGKNCDVKKIKEEYFW